MKFLIFKNWLIESVLDVYVQLIFVVRMKRFRHHISFQWQYESVVWRTGGGSLRLVGKQLKAKLTSKFMISEGNI